MTIPKNLQALLGVGLLCGAGLAVRADDTVTFQVDMSSYTNHLGIQAATLVDVRGGFNGWSGGAGATLYNNGANVYTNTFTVAGAPASTSQYKFTFTTPAGVTWEDNNPPPGAGQPPDAGNNRVLALVGGVQVLPVVPFFGPSVTLPIDPPTNKITFQVDMTAQIQTTNFIPELGDTVTVTGDAGTLGPWNAGVNLTNNPALSGNASNVYSAVVDIIGYPGGSGGGFKFRMLGLWEDTSDGNNRPIPIAGGNQVLPIYYYQDQPPGAITNCNVKFQVDMTPQVITGGFTNGVTPIGISGNINNWPTPATPMTNDPSLSGNASNVYSTTISIANLAGTFPTTTVGMWCRYKFRIGDGYESAAIYGVNNNKDRRFYYVGGDQTLPLVTYNDASICDLLQQPTTVTVLLHITNGTPDNAGVAFDKTNDVIYLNGEFINWNTPSYWNTSLPQMTNNPVGSDYYQQTYVVAAGNTLKQVFKFGISGPGHGGLDNEAPNGANHVAYVRSTGSTYTLPVVQFGTNFTATLVEQQWGNLAVGAASGGHVPVTWLGLPCVSLQTTPSLPATSWTDLPATSGTSSNSWPTAGGPEFFRLQKRVNP